jgi:hypothetical protein
VLQNKALGRIHAQWQVIHRCSLSFLDEAGKPGFAIAGPRPRVTS